MIGLKYGWYAAIIGACWAPNAALAQLPNCTINFDDNCPDTVAECGATFAGGDGCEIFGLDNCYSSDPASYQVSEGGQLTILLSDDLVSLSVFFTHQSSGGSGSMRFVDAEGQEVDAPLASEGPCNSELMPPTQLVFFTRPVRTIEVANIGSGNVWIDTFEVNPPCVGAGDCNDGDACTADTCEAGSCAHALMVCDDEVGCTDDTCVAGNCVFTPNNADCADDGLFCNGVESCDVQSGCVSSGDPCSVGELCDEMMDSCGECIADADCDDGLDSTFDTCESGGCVFTSIDSGCAGDMDGSGGIGPFDLASLLAGWGANPGHAGDLDGDGAVGPLDLAMLLASWGPCPEPVVCSVDADCDDGVFCNGSESCDTSTGNCQDADHPCSGQLCDEENQLCADAECMIDADCDDGAFCSGVETCDPVVGICAAGSDPCPDQMCDESSAACVDCLTNSDCDDGTFCNGSERCQEGACEAGTEPCGGRETCDEVSQACVPEVPDDGTGDDDEMKGEDADTGACGVGSCGSGSMMAFLWTLSTIVALRLRRRHRRS